MDFWLAIVIIVAITSVARIVQIRFSAPARAPGADAETAALAREVAALEERNRVLERIVTENRTTRDLAQEIESLRQA
jgi:hypothetical protein